MEEGIIDHYQYLFRKYNAVDLFKKYVSVNKVAKITGIPYQQVRKLLYDYYKCSSRLELKSKFPLSEAKKNNIMKVKKLCEKYLDFGKVKNKMNISMYHIKQWLYMGGKYNLFDHKSLMEKIEKMESEREKNKIMKIKKLYEKYGLINEVAKKLKLVPGTVSKILQKGEKYKLFKFESLKKKLRLFNKDKRNRIIKTKQLYKKYGTLRGVAVKMGISRERVRQILESEKKMRLLDKNGIRFDISHYQYQCQP